MLTRYRYNNLRLLRVMWGVGLLFFLMCVWCAVPTFGVIYISTIEELQKIGNDPGYPLDGEYELTGDIDASDTVNWDGGMGFSPVGSPSNPFIGRFDGKGYKIRHLYINRYEGGVGLFGYIGEYGEVRNMGLENVHVVGYGSVGGLVGESFGIVSQIYVTGSVVGSGWHVGGLVGIACGGCARIENSYSSCTVNGYLGIGGLVGVLYYESVAVTNCYSVVCQW